MKDTINNFKQTRFYRALELPMMTQYRGIVWADIKLLAVGALFYWFLPEQRPIIYLLCLAALIVTVLTFIVDAAYDLIKREVRIHKETKNWKQVSQEQKSRRDIALIYQATHGERVLQQQTVQKKKQRNNGQQRRDSFDQFGPTPQQHQQADYGMFQQPFVGEQGAARVAHQGETIPMHRP